MEGDNVDICLSGGATGGARWNPTKEQIDMLESLYRQGLRTPSADQIQQITNRLRVFGHIEGKNVFYWFQNHKARQRQKQKQQNFTHFNRLLQKTSVFPPCPNVVCSPVYIPYPDHVALYHHHQPKVLLPRGLKRKPIVEKMEQPKLCTRPNVHDHVLYQQQSCMGDVREGIMNEMRNLNGHQTLDLFPLQPSGNLQSKISMDFDTSGNNHLATPSTSSSADTKCFSDQQFFDFFRENGPCQSH